MALMPPWADIFDLLDLHWTGISSVIEACEELGASWRDRSFPTWVEGPEGVVSHCGRMPLAAMVEGEPATVAALHAVCTHPDHRGTGLARRVMAQQLESLGEGDVPALFAVDPRVYRGLGFVPARHHVLRFRHEHAGAPGRLRPLSSEVTGDARIVLDLGRERVPTGRRFALGADTGWLVVMDELLARRRFERLFVHEGPEPWVVAMEVREDTLLLLDLVAPKLPALRTVLDAIPWPYRRVVLHYGIDAPDLHDFDPASLRDARLERDDPVDTLMVRGLDEPLDAQPFAVSPLALW